MKDWPVKTLGDVCEVLDSLRKPITKRDRVSGEFPYYGATGVVDYVGDFIFDERLVLVGEDGAKWGAGEKTAFIAEGKYWVNNHAHVLRCKPAAMVDSWLANFLVMSDLSKYVSGLTVPKLNQGSLISIEIPVPPLEEQKRIVALLDAAAARITELTECYEKARTHANNLFTSALQSELEGNPDWPVKTLAEVAVVNPSEPALSEDAPFVPMDAVTAGKRDIQYTQPRGQRSGARARTGDILFARITPCLQNGKVALVQDDISRCGGSTEFIVVRAGCGVLNEFLYQWITSKHIRDELTALMKGATGRQRLNAEDLELTELPVPPLEEQKRIVARLDAVRAKTSEMVSAYDVKLQAAKDLRQSILEAAFRGEL
jgi:type I restriction enzyme S subunit